MLRMFPVVALLLFCLPSRVAAELKSSVVKKEADTTNAIIDKMALAAPSDLRPVLTKMRSQNKLVRGKNLVLDAKAQGNRPAFQLFATVSRGKITKWQAVDAGGKNLTTTTQQLDTPEGGAKCTVCIDAQIPGLPPEQTQELCFEIECKDRVAPGTGENIR